MALDGKRIEEITEVDLQTLKSNEVQENKTLEYKSTLPDNSYDAKKEFLADVSAFANASGGYLLFGVKDEGGVPIEVCGIEDVDSDGEKARLENLLRDNIDPRIPGISIRAIELESSAVVFVMFIPRSWAQPHVVRFQKHWRFYSRNSAGKYPLEVSELRAAFNLSESASERIRRFRADRLGKIVAGETPLLLPDVAKIVLHIVPISASDPTILFDVASLAKQNSSHLSPMHSGGWNNRHNFDGFLTYSPPIGEKQYGTYLQIFRNGSIEAVDARLLGSTLRSRPDPPFIPSVVFEEEIIKALRSYLYVQNDLLGVSPPVFIMLALLGVKGYEMAVKRSRFWSVDSHPIDRDSLILPEVIVETFDCDAAEVLRPIFDVVWNAAGWSHSVNYDKGGKWVGQ